MQGKTFSEDEVTAAISIFLHLDSLSDERSDIGAYFSHHTASGVRYGSALLAPVITDLFDALPPNGINFHDDFIPDALLQFSYGANLEPALTLSREETIAKLAENFNLRPSARHAL
jgi:hypothetical protein